MVYRARKTLWVIRWRRWWSGGILGDEEELGMEGSVAGGAVCDCVWERLCESWCLVSEVDDDGDDVSCSETRQRWTLYGRVGWSLCFWWWLFLRRRPEGDLLV